MEDVIIAGYARTPLGSFQGDLAQFSAPELGGKAIEKAISVADGIAQPFKVSVF